MRYLMMIKATESTPQNFKAQSHGRIGRRIRAGTILSGAAVLFLLFDNLGKLLRVGSPLLTHKLFPVYVAVVAWGGLLLRDERLRNVLASKGGP